MKTTCWNHMYIMSRADAPCFCWSSGLYSLRWCSLHSVTDCGWSTLVVCRCFWSSGSVITARQRSCGKVMFSYVSVSLSTRRSPCDHWAWCLGPHCTGTLSSSDTRPGLPPPAPRHQTLACPLATDIWYTLETCSNLFTWGTPPPSNHI